MPIQVSDVEDDEMLRAFTISSVAFERNEPVWDAMYPKHWTEQGRKAAADRWILKKRTDPKAIFKKAVDEDTDTIIGIGHWLVYHPSIPEPKHKIEGEEAQYEADDDVPWCDEIIADFARWRDSAIDKTNGHLVDLECLAVDPAWQRKGAGDALVKFGTQLADRIGVTGVVGASKAGKRVYSKNGYEVDSEAVVLKVPEQFKDRPVQHFDWMMRPKRSG